MFLSMVQCIQHLNVEFICGLSVSGNTASGCGISSLLPHVKCASINLLVGRAAEVQVCFPAMKVAKQGNATHVIRSSACLVCVYLLTMSAYLRNFWAENFI